MAALWNRAGHYIFCPVVSFFLLSFFFSSPNLSGRRLDVYHTSTHGVALVRIYNAGLKCAARGSLEMQDPKIDKNSTSGHHRTICRAISSHRQSEKNLLNSNISPTCPHNTVNFGPLAAEIVSLLWAGAPQQISTGFASSLRYCSDVGQPNFARYLAVSWAGILLLYTRFRRNFARYKIYFAS